MSNLPGMVVMAAGDEAELVHMTETAAAYDDGPIALRYPRGNGVGAPCPSAAGAGNRQGRIVAEGEHVAFLSFGAHLAEVRLAAESLAARGITCTIADARFAKPLDHALIDQLMRHHAAVITVEQGAQGGFGAQVLHYLANSGQLQTGAALRT